ncbi:MAG: hypothetical protein PHE29_13970 [Tissierellia bacterium]|nr:hypothetical protein [Tissierellia bacterium]MDD4779043.1 hypothetical protein [Tissierellia bacterium]
MCKHICKTNDEFHCKIINKKCIFSTPDEQKCSEENNGIINYLKNMGIYEQVLNNPKFTNL